MSGVIDYIKREIEHSTQELRRLQAALAILEAKIDDGEKPPAENAQEASLLMPKIQSVLQPRKKVLSLPDLLVEDHINGMVFKMRPEQKAFLQALGEHEYVSKTIAKECYSSKFSRFYDDLEELRGFAKSAGAEINTYKGPNRGYRLETV
jgi:hypothetical protein